MSIILHAMCKLQASETRSCFKCYLPSHTISAFAGTKSRDGTPTTNSRSFCVENQRERRKLLEHNQRQCNLKTDRHHIAVTWFFSEMHRPPANSYRGYFQLATLKAVGCLVESPSPSRKQKLPNFFAKYCQDFGASKTAYCLVNYRWTSGWHCGTGFLGTLQTMRLKGDLGKRRKLTVDEESQQKHYQQKYYQQKQLFMWLWNTLHCQYRCLKRKVANT